MSTRSSLYYWHNETVGEIHVWTDFHEPNDAIFFEIQPFCATMFLTVLTPAQWEILKGRLNPDDALAR